MDRKAVPKLYAEIVDCPAKNCRGIVRDDHTNIREGMISSVESDGQKATLKYDKIDRGANTVTVTLTCASGATISKTVSVGTPKTIECDDGTTATVNIKEIK